MTSTKKKVTKKAVTKRTKLTTKINPFVEERTAKWVRALAKTNKTTISNTVNQVLINAKKAGITL